MLRPGYRGVIRARQDGVDFWTLRRKRTNGISRRRISGKKERLAAAAAEVLFAAIAGFARRLHPGLPAKFLKRRGLFPNLPQRTVLYIFKVHAGNDLRSVAGKRAAIRGDEHEFAPPATHAGLGKFRVVIGNDKFNANFAFEAFLRFLEEFDGTCELFACGEKVSAIGKSPAVILNVRKFHSTRAGGFGDGQHLWDLVDVAAMNDEIQRDRKTMLLKPFEDTKFLRMRFGVGDFSSDFFTGTLETELDVIKSSTDERGEFLFVEREARSNQVDVEPGGACGADEFNDVSAGERFAAGEVGLENAKFGGLGENARPDFSRKFDGTICKFERIRAVDAMQRATVSEFGNKSQRILICFVHFASRPKRTSMQFPRNDENELNKKARHKDSTKKLDNPVVPF